MKHERWADALMADWGGYARSVREAQGGLHRINGDLIDMSDAVARRGPGHADPLLSNILAEERAGLGFISSLDFCILQYPRVWLRMIVPRYVGIRDDDAEQGWRFAVWVEIEKALGLSERDRKACMGQVRQQVEYDARRILRHTRKEAA